MRRDALRLGPIGITAGLSIVCGIAAASGFSTPGLWLPLALLTVLCLAVGTWSYVTDRDPVSPPILIACLFFVLYVLRPLYILSSGHWGPTRVLDDRAVTAQTVDVMTRASWIVLAGFIALGFGYGLHRSLNQRPQGAWRTIHESVRRFPRPVLRGGSATRFILVSGLLAAYAYWELVRQAGGFAAYLHALSARGGFFFGRAYLLAVTLPLKVATLIVVGVLCASDTIPRRKVFLATILVAAVAAGDFLTGGRAGLLLGTLLPVVLLSHYLRRPLRVRAIVILAAVGLFVFVAARVVTRDAVIQNAPRTQVLVSSLRHLPATTVGGRETIEYDSLMTLVGDSQLKPLLGRTYLPIFTFPVPRALWAGKPAGGGDTWFTEKYYPEYYAAGGHTETSISFVGESYANFGVAGVVAGFFLLGLFVSVLYTRLTRAEDVRTALLYALVLGYVVTLLRGDAFHSVTWAAMTVAVAVLTWPVIATREGATSHTTQPSQEGEYAGGIA